MGDLVLAIGNPFGVGQTVTSGIVSALARTEVGVSDFNFFIQTDAAINPGNSGGALVSMKGKLAGINSAIYSRTGGSLGIGFAIPSNMVRTILQDVQGGKTRIVRPWMGVEGQPVTPDIAASLSLSRPAGVLVNTLHARSPAKAAGLKIGDVVTAINGHPVDDIGTLRFRIATLPLGQTATLKVLRKGQPVDVVIPLIAPPEDPPRDLRTLKGNHPLSGAAIANLSPAVADELRLESEAAGVAVFAVA
ncbi:MAG: PDZ domain-containing protein, partial [Pseudomonadota bacterium]|nr:PDZ domain-containing protein [Pseudomonadota bacterium]